MLTEHFIASIGAPTRAVGASLIKDAGIFLHEYQPLVAQRAIFKKSATPPNCLAVSESHIFAAQAEKAVVHVYNREKGNQEATVPFTERITCLALACEDSVLILGTTEGRIFLWETATGRQVTTAQSHLQAVNKLAVDAASNFLVSASADSTCHVWSIPALLSFSNAGSQPLAPLHTFSAHRSAVEVLAIGHSKSFQNIAITAAQDKTCLIWDFGTNAVLRTYLLPHTPTSITLEAADRAFFVGYEDGSVQRIDLFVAGKNLVDGLHSPSDALAPIQPKSTLWSPSDTATGQVLSMNISFDGTVVLSGHQSGSILSWDVATGHMKPVLAQGPLPGPVTNLAFLPTSGFQADVGKSLRLEAIVKPKFGAFQETDAGDGAVPGNYALHAHLTSVISSDAMASPPLFQQALSAPSLPVQMLDQGLNELVSWRQSLSAPANGAATDTTDDFMALDEPISNSNDANLKNQNMLLKAELDALRRVQVVSFNKLEKLQAEQKALRQREQARLRQQTQKDQRAGVNGTIANAGKSESESEDGDEDMDSSENNG